jgi:hypothetical protein
MIGNNEAPNLSLRSWNILRKKMQSKILISSLSFQSTKTNFKVKIKAKIKAKIKTKSKTKKN